MALHVSAIRPPGATTTRLRVLQTGEDDTARWRRYFELMGTGWTGSLAAGRTSSRPPDDPARGQPAQPG